MKKILSFFFKKRGTCENVVGNTKVRNSNFPLEEGEKMGK